MKKIFSFILILVLICLGVGCGQAEKEEAVLPPTRVGTGTMYMSLPQYTFETACSTADVIAHVKVGNWIAEDTVNEHTFFEATTLRCLKGSIPENFTLAQDGSSCCTGLGYPLFASGNELLLFLKESHSDKYEEYLPLFYIIGSHTTVIDVAYDSDGTRYYLDRTGTLGSTVEGCKDLASTSAVKEELQAYIYKTDPFLETAGYRTTHIFKANELDAAIEEQVEN